MLKSAGGGSSASGLASYISSAYTTSTTLFAENYGVSASNADNSSQINAALLAAMQQNATLVFPAGQFGIQNPINLTGPTTNVTPTNGNGPSQGAAIVILGSLSPCGPESSSGASSAGTVIYWNTTAYAGTMFTIESVETGIMSGMCFDGVGLVQDVVKWTGVNPTFWAPQNWQISNCKFNRAGATYCGVHLDSGVGQLSNNTNFQFLNCCWNGSGGYAFGQFGNNNINTQIIGASINCYSSPTVAANLNIAGIQCEFGTMWIQDVAFYGHSTADILVTNGSTIQMKQIWSQNSNAVLQVNYFSAPFNLGIDGLNSSSCPFALYKQGGRTAPASNALQYAHMLIEAPGLIVTMKDVHLADPFNGAQGQFTGYIVAENIGWNSGEVPWSFTNVSSEYWTGSGSGQTLVTTGFYGAYTGGATPTPFQVLGLPPIVLVSTPTTGTTVSPTSDVSNVALQPAGTLATLTLKMPPRPYQGQTINWKSSQTITSATPSADATVNTSATVAGASAFTMNPHVDYSFTWDFASNTWS